MRRSDTPADQLLHRTDCVRISRRTVNGDVVIWKEAVGPRAIDRLRQERLVLERLTGIPDMPRLARLPHPRNVLVLRDAGGVLLSRFLRPGAFTTAAQLDIALALAGSLAALHRAGVLHGALNTTTVVLRDGGRGGPMIVDFSHAMTTAERQPQFVHHGEIDGPLAELAPEQTGRTGRLVDHRADLYGLGAILYHVITGGPPFPGTDPLRLIHDVLAVVPVAPAELDPAVPRQLSDIVMRLLEKEPDRRYQSAEGVARDLARLRDHLAEGSGEPFDLASHDYPVRLSAPGRLIGRQAELASLASALDDALAGACSGVLVSGDAGVGKTALINEVRPMVAARGGWFVAGKFDQYRRDLAADGMSQALRALGRMMLTESDADLLRHRSRLRQALGANAPLLASIQPEIALVLGLTPEPADGDAPGTRERLVRSSVEVFRAVASADHPIVLVLDDLQWAGETPISQIDALVRGTGRSGLLVIGAYRTAEIDVTHPLSAALARWRRLPIPPVELRPDNLPVADLGELLGEMLRLPAGQAMPLAEVVRARSGGNPFDSVAVVEALYEDGALTRDDGGWTWDLAVARRHVGDGDVVELLAGRIDRLPSSTGEVLGQMACLGSEIDADLLGLACGLSPDELDERLAPALEDGLLVLEQGDRGGADVVRFRHDRVQQAAAGRQDDPAGRRLRLELARRLAASPQHGGLAAEQYLPVAEQVTDPAERDSVIELFRAAARTPLLNPERAERYLASAIALLDQRRQAGDEAGRLLRVSLETSHHTALYRLGRLVDADERYRSIERLHRHALELAEAACVQISSLTFRERPRQAVALGLDLLTRLGLDVPSDDRVEAQTEAGLRRFVDWAAAGGPEHDLQRCEASDPYGIAEASLINRMIPPAFFAGMPVMPWLMLECQRLWVEHGPYAALVGPLSHAGFTSVMLAERYPQILRGREFHIGYDAVRRVLAVSEAHGHQPETAQALLLLALSSAQWFEPVETVVGYAQYAADVLAQTGDQQNAGFAAFALIPGALECTPTLAEYLARVDRGLDYALRTGNDHTRTSLIGYRRLALALLGRPAGAGGPSDDASDLDRHRAESSGNAVAGAYTNLADAIGALIDGDLARLGGYAAAAMSLLPAYVSTLSMATVHLLQAIALAAALRAKPHPPAPQHVPGLPRPSTEIQNRQAILDQLDRCRQWLARRAVDAPCNFEHLLSLVDAERAWALDDFRGAVAAYDAALCAVRDRQRPWHAALISERAARFHLANGLEHTGRALMAEARDRYQAWGAVAKVRALQRAHAFLQTDAGDPRRSPGARPDLAPVESIDLLAVLRACRVLSSQTSASRLHSRIREVLSAITGATDVRLVLWRDDPKGWYLPATDDAPAADATGLLPLSAFRYAERTQEPLLVADVAGDDRFSGDPYLRAGNCRSLLIVPVPGHRAPQAMLVLEHRLIRDAFSVARLDAVRLLTGQLAVALANSTVYEQLEERVRQRTEELRTIQSELIVTARRVGMAEIATNVLHNVGNVLNSVNTSAGMAADRIRGSRIDGLARAVDLLHDHRDDLGAFLTTDERGRLLPEYLAKLADALRLEQRDVLAELQRLNRDIDHIKDIVSTQQTYAGSTNLVEPTDVTRLIEDAVRVNAEALGRHRVNVVRTFDAVPRLGLDRVRILPILVNLISNAMNAMVAVDGRTRRLALTCELVGASTLRIGVADNGEGISPENLAQIFGRGFTTRRQGHGFGLHSCALAAEEMGGTLTASSDGPGRGARFVLELPVVVEPTTGVIR